MDRNTLRNAAADPFMRQLLSPSDWLPRRKLKDGTWGWHVPPSRGDLCWPCTVATVLCVPLSKIPDPQIDRQLAHGASAEKIDADYREVFGKWLQTRGLAMSTFRPPWLGEELPPRWLAVVELPGVHNDHCLTMTGDEVLHDCVPDHPTRRVRRFDLSDVSYGIEFVHTQPKEQTS